MIRRSTPSASSAGNTRGLIEAAGAGDGLRAVVRLPRGIPAASLKLKSIRQSTRVSYMSSAGNTRGLIEAPARPRRRACGCQSSAGNTRGLIEAQRWPSSPAPQAQRLPRGIPAASLKHRHTLRCRYTDRGLPRGIPAASLKPHLALVRRVAELPASSAGNTRGLIEAGSGGLGTDFDCESSAGNTRGLIEARWRRGRGRRPHWGLPRGIPAASLKLRTCSPYKTPSHCLPRGIPAASLKRTEALAGRPDLVGSSAGNTRGLIEARMTRTSIRRMPRLPRGIPAASLKRWISALWTAGPPCLPRGIPAASLKPHLALVRRVAELPASSAGNTRGLIEAGSGGLGTDFDCESSAGNTRGLIEARWRRGRGRRPHWGLPRGIPAASLKLRTCSPYKTPSHCLPRGIPAASLKRTEALAGRPDLVGSSAGNTRGLIEARMTRTSIRRMPRLPRGIPAASLKRWISALWTAGPPCLPRGIPAASLKLRVERGAVDEEVESSAGNTRGLIEAASCARATLISCRVFRGEYPRPH